jgi:hypothetical protein
MLRSIVPKISKVKIDSIVTVWKIHVHLKANLVVSMQFVNRWTEHQYLETQ